MAQLWMSIDKIIFGQTNIGRKFYNGKDLTQLCSDMIRGKIRVTSLSQIQVACVGGQWLAVGGNRRLYVFKKLHSRGKLRSSKIPVKLSTRIGERKIIPTTLDKLWVRKNKKMWKELDDVIDGVVVIPDPIDMTSRYLTRQPNKLPPDVRRTDGRKKRHDIVMDDYPISYQRVTNKRKKPRRCLTK